MAVCSLLDTPNIFDISQCYNNHHLSKLEKVFNKLCNDPTNLSAIRTNLSEIKRCYQQHITIKHKGSYKFKICTFCKNKCINDKKKKSFTCIFESGDKYRICYHKGTYHVVFFIHMDILYQLTNNKFKINKIIPILSAEDGLSVKSNFPSISTQPIKPVNSIKMSDATKDEISVITENTEELMKLRTRLLELICILEEKHLEHLELLELTKSFDLEKIAESDLKQYKIEFI